MTEPEAPEISTDLVPTNTTTAVDLRDAVTDSWTDVLDQVADLAIKIAQTDFVPVDYRGKPGQVAAAILHGRELGMPPLTALALTAPIKGKPTIMAEGMRSLVLQAGHQIAVTESSSSRVVLRGRRAGEEEWTTVTWTQDDARRAGLSGTNWQKYPRQMLTARATAELCRLIFADVLHGMRAAEELADEIDQITPAPEAEQPEKKTTTVRRQASKKTTTKKAAEPAPEPEEEKPARKRAQLPPRKPRPHPERGENDDPPTNSPHGESSPEEPTTAPQPVPDQNDTEPASGEADGHEMSTGRETGPQLTAGQRASVIMHFSRLQIDDRDERLWWTNHFLELEPGTITSTNELRQPEAVRLLAKLERFKDRDQLDASLNQDQLIPNDPQE